MIVHSVELENFRNISSLILEADSGVNVIYGENAQGKTNILEAIWLMTGLKSFRGSKDAELLKFNEEIAKLKLKFSDNLRNKETQLIFAEKKKNIFHNGVNLKSSGELVGSFYAVIFSPDHLSLIKNGPSERRRFLDTAICQLRPSYASALANYKRVLVQRNALLKDLHLNSQLYDMLESWNYQLAKFSSLIIIERLKYIEDLSEYSKEIYNGISENKERFNIKYSLSGEIGNNASLEDIYNNQLKLIKESIKDDILAKSTTIGPHRDDIEILLNGVSARSYGSQGQQRSCALALKLGESEIVKKKTGETPVALLDDVMSELDEKRQDYVLNRIKDRQVFLTCCDPSQVLRMCKGKTFLVKGGKIK